MDEAELRRRFEHHPPTRDAVVEAHQWVRDRCLDLALHLNELLIDGYEKDEALTAVDEVCVWANASIARTQLLGPARQDVPAGWIGGFVVDAGGGEVRIVVDRETMSYPAVNQRVILQPYEGASDNPLGHR